ncbi:hypothetical protein PMZ80_001049 [Knufia obscura]|uniref:F-box domain-containing protein n=1 Tax=Knufia obscura TaxID=1635080 RepID=A0ABR0S218_9EURO|nr:hypothetical protein PMZ80_001049 [Knufia obscura]
MGELCNNQIDGVEPPQPSLQGLPPELSALILQHLDKKELKSLRLASKSFRDATTTPLFQHYTLYPHETSFERLLSIANTPALSCSVVELEINTAFRSLARIPPRYLVPPIPELYNRFGRVSDKVKKRKPPDQIAKVATALRNIYSKTFAGGNTSDELSQMVFLQRIFTQLSKLRHLRITDAFYNNDLPSFYSTLLPEFCTSDTKAYSHLLQDFTDDENVQQSYALGVLAATRDVSSLRKFQMHGIDWEDFLGIPDLFKRPILYRESLARLKHLEMTTEMGKHHWDGDVTLNLQALLRLADNLEVLILWFRSADDAEVGGETLYDWAYDEHCKSNFQLDLADHDEDFEGPIEVPARLTWSSVLRQFELKGLICTSGEIESILAHCAVSLESLSLSDLVLVPETKTGPRACFVKLFKWMQQNLHLQELELEGFFTNGGMQDWTFLHDTVYASTEENLKGKVLGFVLHGAACPLDHLEIPDGQFDLGKMRYKKEAPAMFKKDETFKGDESLYMEYNDHEDVPSDVEDEDSDEDDDDDDDHDDEDEDEDTESDDSGTEEVDEDEWESATDGSLD